MFLELKYENNTPTLKQRDFMRAMQEAGHYCCVCYSAAAAIKALECYINLNGESQMTEACFEGVFDYQIHKTWGIPVIKP